MTTRKIFLGRGKGTWRIRQKCDSPVDVYSLTPLLSYSFYCILPISIYKEALLIGGQRVVDLQKISYRLAFVFNSCRSFVNPLLQLIVCVDGVYICKIRKNVVSCHAVADKLLVEWLYQENYDNYRNKE